MLSYEVLEVQLCGKIPSIYDLVQNPCVQQNNNSLMETAVTFIIINCFEIFVQVFLGQSGALDVEGNELPRLVYVSREKRPGYQHHKKAGAENALVGKLA